MRVLSSSWNVCLVLTIAWLLVPVRAYGGTQTFPDFSNTAGLTLSGTAVTAMTSDGPVLRLTLATTTESGSTFGSNPINAADFSTSFKFRLSHPGGAADPNAHFGGDGVTFAIQPVSASLGGSGQGLGIGGITPSIAVEFDTWFNSPDLYPQVSDPSSNHIGIDINGNVHSVATIDVAPFMDDGNVWYAWIDYDGTTLNISANETGVRPTAPQLRYPVDIPGILGVNAAFVGFTAGTGGSFQDQDILSWTYFDHYVDGGGAAPNDDGGTNSGGGDAPTDEGGDGTVGVADLDGGSFSDVSASSSGDGGPEASHSTHGRQSGGCGCVVGTDSRGRSGGALLGLALLGVLRGLRGRGHARRRA